MAKICEAPLKQGPRKGLPATGSSAGHSRHRRAGEDACEECLAAMSAKGAKWLRDHPEAREKSRRAWDARNPDRAREYSRSAARRWSAKPEVREDQARKFAEWRLKNLDRMAGHERLRRARVSGVQTHPFTLEQLAAKVAYWGNRCWICKGPYESVDHVKPVSKGGPHMLANLRPACSACNSAKHATWPYSEVLKRVAHRLQMKEAA